MTLLEASSGLLLALTALPIAQDPAPGNDRFPAIVWRLDHPDRPVERRFVEAFGGVNVEGTAEARWARGEGLEFYVGHAPGRNDLHLQRDFPWYEAQWTRYWEDRDPAPLVRQPCLSQEETYRRLRDRIFLTLAARDGEHGLGVSLGDEVGLTPYGAPFDLCGSRACREAFASFLAESERWNQLREEGRPLPFPDTETTCQAWLDGDASHVAAWLARREFHYEVMIGLLARLAAVSRERSPATPVGLFGLGGRTAFGGVGPEAILPHLDFIESYPILDSRELLYTLREPGVRSFATIFRQMDAPHSPTWQVWEHWLRGGDGVILWCDRDLSEDETYFETLRDAVAAVRELRARLPGWAPAPRGGALIHHADSLALSWLRDALHDGATWPKRFASYHNEHGTREVALRACLRWLEDAGLLPGSLPLERVGAETVVRFPFLVANELIVVEEEELRALRSYVEAGGTLLLHGGFAVYDRRGARSRLGARESLEKLAPERVIGLELKPAYYLAERSRSGSPYAQERIDLLRGILGSETLPEWRPAQRKSQPRWLLAQSPLSEGGGFLCAAVPNLPDPPSRAALRALRIEIEGVDPARITWIHPAPPTDEGGAVVRLKTPGEALVFRLAPPR